MRFQDKLKGFVILAFAFLFIVSCVSKKKFLDMQGMKTRAEARVAKLTGENNDKEALIESLYGQFNQMKNELLESNAQKDTHIDSLSKSIVGLHSSASEKDATLEEKLFAFKYEKRQYNETIRSLEQKNSGLNKQLEVLGKQVKQLNEQLTAKNFELNKHSDEKIRLDNQLEVKKNEMVQLEKNITACKNEITSLKKTMAQKEQEIKRLNNNVKLLKSQLGK